MMKLLKRGMERLWEHIRERERIRVAKEVQNRPWPWTKDDIFQTYKFTNVKREHDRTTRAFLEVYKKQRDAPKHIALYNCGLRRFTGTVAASDALGWAPQHDVNRIRNAEARCNTEGLTFWTGAYMIRGGAAGVPKYRVVGEYLKGLWQKGPAIIAAMEDEASPSWRVGYQVMHDLYGFGGNGFMCKEVLQDYLLWRREAGLAPLLDEDTWTPMGPGARRGLNRLAGRPLKEVVPMDQMLAEVAALRDYCNDRWTKAFPQAAPLTAHDIQFQLCEVDKYIRVERGEGRPRSRYRAPEED